MNEKDRFDLKRNRKVKLRTLQVIADKLRLQAETGEPYFRISDSACIKLFIEVTKEIERLCAELKDETTTSEPYMLGEIIVEPGSTLDRLSQELSEKGV